MTDQLITALVSVVVALIGLAALATVLSPNAKTSQVINAGSSGLAQNIAAAVSPVTGGSGIGAIGSYGQFGNGV